jgi:hypothetical protein
MAQTPVKWQVPLAWEKSGAGAPAGLQILLRSDDDVVLTDEERCRVLDQGLRRWMSIAE